MIISSISYSSFALDNRLVGVWINTKSSNIPETIEFRRNGVYIKSADRIFQMNNRELVTTSFKQINSETYEWKLRKVNTGEMMDIPVKFKFNKEKLILIDVLGRKKIYEKLNNKELDSYATNLKLHKKSVAVKLAKERSKQEYFEKLFEGTYISKNTYWQYKKGKHMFIGKVQFTKLNDREIGISIDFDGNPTVKRKAVLDPKYPKRLISKMEGELTYRFYYSRRSHKFECIVIDPTVPADTDGKNSIYRACVLTRKK